MGHTGPILEGRGNSDYERYVRVPELLELQKEVSKLAHPEERLFQTMHQTAELWLHHVDYEIDRTVEHLRKEELEIAADLLGRCSRILDLLREQITILESMAPADYHVIRTSSLGQGSGQESPGFQRLLDVGKRLGVPCRALLERRSLTPLEVQRHPRQHYAFYRLLEALMEYDSAFMKWRYTHLRLAVRVIGSRVKSLKGVPVTQLEEGTREALFPELWDAISDLTEEFKPEY
jgi:tryptophan 2,3-dioxygenase